METTGDTIVAVLTAVTGFGWAAYFTVGAAFVSTSLVIEYIRTKGKTRG